MQMLPVSDPTHHCALTSWGVEEKPKERNQARESAIEDKICRRCTMHKCMYWHPYLVYKKMRNKQTAITTERMIISLLFFLWIFPSTSLMTGNRCLRS